MFIYFCINHAFFLLFSCEQKWRWQSKERKKSMKVLEKIKMNVWPKRTNLCLSCLKTEVISDSFAYLQEFHVCHGFLAFLASSSPILLTWKQEKESMISTKLYGHEQGIFQKKSYFINSSLRFATWNQNAIYFITTYFP